MKAVKKYVFANIAAGLIGASLATAAFAGGTDGTIYDPHVLSKLSFSSKQLPAVKQVLDKSEVAIMKVFTKYSIDPKAKPDFDKLRAASNELQSVEAWEKKQMKRILSKEQYADYLELQQATAAAVIKATRDD